MKYFKILMLIALAVPFFASCSDDDVNTAECTIGFGSDTYTMGEASGYVNIPITVTGRRNGPIHVTVEAAPTGENGAVEGEHYVITDKTLNLNADTLSTGTINVEIKTINDDEVNENRSFTLTLTSVEGGQVSRQSTTVIINDDDSDLYMSFFGQWYLHALSLVSGQVETYPVTITGAGTTDESDYNRTLHLSGDLGLGIALNWTFAYSYDESAETGTVGFNLGEVMGQAQTMDPVTGTEVLTVDIVSFGAQAMEGVLSSNTWRPNDTTGLAPTEIEFPANDLLYYGFVYQGSSYYFGGLSNISLTREP